MMTSNKLTIFEGPDGSGKTTAAKAFAKASGARYVHFPALPRVNKGLARMYVEAMIPALLGYQDVVFDRCWLSEGPYGAAFREGQDRLGDPIIRMLERLALRCGVVVVRCLPDFQITKQNYLSRKHLEMLDNERQLSDVYNAYGRTIPHVATVDYDYVRDPNYEALWDSIEEQRYPLHPLSLQSAGNWNGHIVLVGHNFAERKDQDSFYQWPFASFSGEGCSRWLAEQLDRENIVEDTLMWLNSDQNLEVIHELKYDKVIALGDEAAEQLYRLKITAQVVPHPQAWKRFNSRRRYPLLDLL